MPGRKPHRGRRAFLKAGALAAAGAAAPGQNPSPPAADRFRVLAAVGDTIVPSRPGDPGYRDLESHGISREVNQTLTAVPDRDFAAFDAAAAPHFGGRHFLSLTEEERSRFLTMVLAGEGPADGTQRQSLLRFYRLVRIAVLKVYYSNFPENRIPRDGSREPVVPPGDLHQVTAPNTAGLVTGWDIAGFRGPLTWDQEQQMRSRVQALHWHDDLEALIVRYRPKKEA